jgi:rRNA biogenesis protein RRP5
MALRNFREGDPVKAAIISVDAEKRRISFSLKPSHFSAEDLDEEDALLNEGESGQGDIEMADGDEVVNDYDSQSESAESSEGEGMDVDGFLASLSKPAQVTSEGPGASTSDAAAPLKLQTGFQWTEERPDDDDEASSDDDDENEHEKKKKRKRKKEIEQDLTGDLHTKVPESTADFERNLLASPNSSYLWIQYMSFQLQLAEVEKAREIGKRALQTISIREEQEKLNVWIALMNLENTYGSDESLEALFKDAARHNDSKTVHLRLASILDQSQKTEVSKLYHTLIVLLLIRIPSESRRTIQANLQEIRTEQQSMVTVWRALLPTRRSRTRSQTSAS